MVSDYDRARLAAIDAQFAEPTRRHLNTLAHEIFDELQTFLRNNRKPSKAELQEVIDHVMGLCGVALQPFHSELTR